jgi:hypothetical protein
MAVAVFCLCDAGGETAALYLDSFERIWAGAAPGSASSA